MDTIQELVKYGYYNYKEKNFIHYKEENKYKPVTFEKTIDDIIYLSESLLQLGLRGKKIILVGENSYEWLISWISIIGYVGIAIPIDKMWTYHDIDQVLVNTKADVIIHTNFNEKAINQLKDKYKEIKYINIKEELIGLIENGKKINSLKKDKFDFKEIESTEICEIRYSGGTTSFPKAITLTQKNLLSNMVNMLKRAPMDNEDSVLLFLPLHHAYSSICAFLYSFYSGIQNYIGSGLNNLIEDLKLAKPTILTGVPLIYYKFLDGIDDKKKKKINFFIHISNCLRKIKIDLRKVVFKEFYNVFGGNIKYWFCAGSYLKLDVKKLYSDMGIKIQCAYGLTECSSLVALEYYNKEDFSSAGEVLENQEIIILNPNENGEGEILVKGDQLTPGYYNNEKLNENSFDENVFFYTGDIGRLDKYNNIYIVGRKKRVIITDGGKNIYPEYIEEIIMKFAGIDSVKIYEDNNKICAQIVTNLSYNEVEKMIKEVNSQIATYMQIENYVVKSTNEVQIIK